MMKRFIFLSVLFLGFSFNALAVDLDGDLSGAWRMTFSDRQEHNFQYDIVLTRTTLRTEEGNSPYYSVFGSIADMKLVGASIVRDDRGTLIHWYRLAAANVAKGTRLDGEYNLVLRNEENVLVLGGDHARETNEVARMTKLPFLVP